MQHEKRRTALSASREGTCAHEKFKIKCGIDCVSYASAEINWLSCASRDATLLHALFSDTLDGETMLLTDGQATVAVIRDSFEQLRKTDPDDVVVTAFSGHGTESHELVAHDTDPYNLAATTIPLATLSEWCACLKMGDRYRRSLSGRISDQ